MVCRSAVAQQIALFYFDGPTHPLFPGPKYLHVLLHVSLGICCCCCCDNGSLCVQPEVAGVTRTLRDGPVRK